MAGTCPTASASPEVLRAGDTEAAGALHPEALPDAEPPSGPASPSAAPSAVAGAAAATGRGNSATPALARTPARAEPEEPEEPLRVVIDRLRPAVVPTEGDLVVTGTVTNVSESRWTDNKVYLLTSTDPMTTEDEIDDAVASDPDIEIGDRLIDPGLFQVAPDLEPGDSTRFRLVVPARRLLVSGEPGVYWLGIHVLGTDETGRIEGADGRARTLLPLVPDRATTRLALGMPFRRHVVREADGTLLYDQLWAAQLRSGRLERVRAFAASALPDADEDSTDPPRRPRRDGAGSGSGSGSGSGGGSSTGTGAGREARGGDSAAAREAVADDAPDGWPLTWLVDGALLDAADSLSAGNPAIDLASDGSNEVTAPDDEPSEEETAARAAEDDPAARAATRWVDRFVADARRTSVLALPYGDLDVSAAADGTQGPEIVSIALNQSQSVLSARGVSSAPVVAPPSGYLSPEGLGVLDPDLRVILGRAAIPEDLEDPDDPTVFAAPRGGALTTVPSDEGIWGPGPGRTHSALAVRQRMLAEAAVHALSEDAAEPLVTVLPALWDPGRDWERSEFFDALAAQPWLDGVSLSSVVDPAAVGSVTVRGDDLVYPDEEVLEEVPAYAVAASAALVDRSLTLQDLLTDDAGLGERVDRQALLTSSVWSRTFPGVATQRARDAVTRVDDWLGGVSIRGPSFITMSSESGTFQVTLVNGLDQAVTVGLSATVSGGPLQLTTPDPVDLPPGGRRPMRIEADATDIGVHQVTLQPVSQTGRALGQTSTLSVRSSKVGMILWFIMAGGGAALFGAITVRTVRRLLARRRRRTAGATA